MQLPPCTWQKAQAKHKLPAAFTAEGRTIILLQSLIVAFARQTNNQLTRFTNPRLLSRSCVAQKQKIVSVSWDNYQAAQDLSRKARPLRPLVVRLRSPSQRCSHFSAA